jgi:hypothetical protein
MPKMLEIFVPQYDQEKTTNYHKNREHLIDLWVYSECVVWPKRKYERSLPMCPDLLVRQ